MHCIQLCYRLLLISVGCSAWAGDAALPVIPGLRGFGVETRAGRGGQVITVTTLAEDGPGSLRQALAMQGPRTIIFAVAGVIDLGTKPIVIQHPFVTVAGQTAPDPGITIIGSGLVVETHDLLMQHLAIRPGDKGGKGHEPDCLSCYSGKQGNYRVVIDHCSLTWGIDENLGINETVPDQTHDITITRCLIAHGLSKATHAKGEHSKGVLIQGGAQRIALIDSVMAHNYERNPMIGNGASLFMANCLIWNPGWAAVTLCGDGVGKRTRAALVANICVCGPQSRDHVGFVAGKLGVSEAYLEGNIVRDTAGRARPLLTSAENEHLSARAIAVQSQAMLWPEGYRPHPAQGLQEALLTQVGSRPARRHALDAAIIEGIRSGAGRIIDRPEQGGGYPRDALVRKRLDPPSSTSDADGDGYSDLEEWLQAAAARVEGR